MMMMMIYKYSGGHNKQANKQTSVRACLLDQPVERSSDDDDGDGDGLSLSLSLFHTLHTNVLSLFSSSSDGRPVSAARLSCQRDGIELVVRASLQAGCKQNAAYLWHLHQVVPLNNKQMITRHQSISFHVTTIHHYLLLLSKLHLVSSSSSSSSSSLFVGW